MPELVPASTLENFVRFSHINRRVIIRMSNKCRTHANNASSLAHLVKARVCSLPRGRCAVSRCLSGCLLSLHRHSTLWLYVEDVEGLCGLLHAVSVGQCVEEPIAQRRQRYLRNVTAHRIKLMSSGDIFSRQVATFFHVKCDIFRR